MLESIASLAEIFVPLLQTAVWPIFFGVLVWMYGEHIPQVVGAVRKRVEQGSAIEVASVLKLGPLNELSRHEPIKSKQVGEGTSENGARSLTEDWEDERNAIYSDVDGYFLAHLLTPSGIDKDGYDIFIYLIRHQRNDVSGPQDLSDVVKAEFYLGKMWGYRVFDEFPRNAMVGMRTSAYAPFLCVCHVHLKDGRTVKIHRYIDFEMGKHLAPSIRARDILEHTAIRF